MTLIRKANYGYPTLNNWFEDFLAPIQNLKTGWYKSVVPAVNIKEDDNKFDIEFAVPGLSKADFSINLENDVLTVKSEKESSNENSDSNYTRKEFSYTSFQRSFTLPETVDGENIKAEYKDGILSIQIPKKEEAKAKPAKEIVIA